MKFCLVGKDDNVLFVDSSFCRVEPKKKQKTFNVYFIDFENKFRCFEAAKIHCSDFEFTNDLFLEVQQ